jgi:hypothetical protein
VEGDALLEKHLVRKPRHDGSTVSSGPAGSPAEERSETTREAVRTPQTRA